jgi:hypothetical protein
VPAIADAARTTAVLERGGEFQQPGFIEGEIGYGRHAFAPSALAGAEEQDGLFFSLPHRSTTSPVCSFFW